MIHRTLSSLVLALICSSAFQYVGCSLIGYGIGSAIDSGKPEYDSLSAAQVLDLWPGTTVRVIGKDVDIRGEFIEIEEPTAQNSREAYPAWRAQGDSGRMMVIEQDDSTVQTVRIPLEKIELIETRSWSVATLLLGTDLVVDAVIVTLGVIAGKSLGGLSH